MRKQRALFLGLLVFSAPTKAQDYIQIPGSSPDHSAIEFFTQKRSCAEQDQVPERFIFSDVPTSLLKTHFIKLEWTPILKGRWNKKDRWSKEKNEWVWTQTTKAKPLQHYQVKISFQEKGKTFPSLSNPIVYNYKNSLTLCLLELEILGGNLVRFKFESSLEMEGKDLAPFVTFSIAGKAKAARWTTLQGFKQPAAELELFDEELAHTLDVTIQKTIRFANQSIQLPKAYRPKFDLRLLEDRRMAARFRVPASALNSKEGVKETCEKDFYLADIDDPRTCHYNGEVFTGGNLPEAMSLLTAAQCKKGRPVIDRCVQCLNLSSFVYSFLWDEYLESEIRQRLPGTWEVASNPAIPSAVHRAANDQSGIFYGRKTYSTGQGA